MSRRLFYVDGTDVVCRSTNQHTYFDTVADARQAAKLCNASPDGWARGYEWYGDSAAPEPLKLPVSSNPNRKDTAQ